MSENYTFAVNPVTGDLSVCIGQTVTTGDVFRGLAYGNVAENKRKLPDGAKTILRCETSSNGLNNLMIDVADDEGYVKQSSNIISDIVNVAVIDNSSKNKVVIVTFADGSVEKAVLSDNDEFSLEQGISVCITKKLLSNMIGGKYGSSVYNKLIERGVKVYKKRIIAAKKKLAEEAAKKEKYKKIVAKKQEKRKKRIAEERENQIEIQKEAYLRAMHEYNTRSAD